VGYCFECVLVELVGFCLLAGDGCFVVVVDGVVE